MGPPASVRFNTWLLQINPRPSTRPLHRATRSRCLFCQKPVGRSRGFSTSTARDKGSNQGAEGNFRSRLRGALHQTKIEWRPIPIGLGIGFLGFVQFYRIQRRERQKQDERDELQDAGNPKKRKRIRPSGPWQVQVMSTLPLKAVSRLWGRFNEMNIPYYLRVPGFKLYSWIFGVNLSEISEPDLHNYPNLASFFYRTLKPGIRPLDSRPTAIVSPADGRILQFGLIERGEVEQVKGMTYSLDALLGSQNPSSTIGTPRPAGIPPKEPPKYWKHLRPGDSVKKEEMTTMDEEFANLNGISYTLPNLFSGPTNQSGSNPATSMDASTKPKSSSVTEVRADLARGDENKSWFSYSDKSPTALYYAVIYLAPGDYHRFHSPTSWVVENRRHFAGELYSVSPYLQRTLPGLFTLNERVVLLGRWRWGFFSVTPVGATNVGSIKINFDRELRTNSLTTDTAADRAAEEASQRGEPYSGYAEATYAESSKILGGHALQKGEEMGGFQLGSSIVIVFEAPRTRLNTLDWRKRKEAPEGGWQWRIEKGQKIRYGETLGWVDNHEVK